MGCEEIRSPFLVEDVAVLVLLILTGGGGQRGDVVLGEKAVIVMAALDILGDQQRIF